MVDVKVIDIKQHGDSGYIEVTVRAVSGGKQGPMRTYGIDVDTLKNHFNADPDLWLQNVKGRHQAQAGMHESLSEKLMSYKGKNL